ncbi:MAG TPA: FAD-dependent oxidoreductase [Pseudonocardia sp.]
MAPLVAMRQPARVGPLTVRNRIVFAAHLTNYAVDGLPTARHAAYYGARAAGGAGLVITEEHSVHPGDLPYEKLIRGYDPAALPGYRLITEAVHAHGAAVRAQLNHNGGQSSGRYPRRPVWAPSAVPDPTFAEVPVAMTAAQIDELVAGYADEAGRCVAGGFDGVELQCSQPSVVRQFLSPALNQRDDDYGGPLRHRARFLLEVLDAVRAVVAPDHVVGVRLGCEHAVRYGGERAELVEVATVLAGTGRIGYLNSAVGVAGALQRRIAPPMGVPAGYALPVASALRAATGLPVIGIGRFTTAEQADSALTDGAYDLVGVVRGQVSDPDLVDKWFRGTAPRTGLGCNQECVGRVGLNRSLGCVQNPRAGREVVRMAGPVMRRRVVVVGGGPAGLRAAATAAERGHRVTLCEAEPDTGGQVTLAASASGRAELGLAVNSLRADCARAGVVVHTGTAVDAGLPRRLDPDAVVLATGSRPARPPWAVAGVYDVLAGQASPAGDVMVYDELGFHQAASVALLLADRGARVRLLTPAMTPVQDLGTTLDRARFRRRAAALGVRCANDRVILDATVTEPGRVLLTVLHHPTGLTEREECAAVVCAVPAEPVDELWRELGGGSVEPRRGPRGGWPVAGAVGGSAEPHGGAGRRAGGAAVGGSAEPRPAVYRVGDCLTPRRLDAAIADGQRVGEAL